MSPKSNDNAATYDNFKKVRNKIREYNAEFIIFQCIETLNHEDAVKIERVRFYPPWAVLLLLKWTLIYGDYDNYLKMKGFHKQAFYKLLNLLNDFSGSVKSPSEYDNSFLFLRHLAFQQFWIQEPYPIILGRLARQSLLFRNLSSEHSLKELFRDKTGISIEDFIDLALMTITRFIAGNETFIMLDWFSTVGETYPPEKVERFLNILSKDTKSIKSYLLENGFAKKDLTHQCYEPSPLQRFPLLRHEEKYYCYSRYLLLHTLHTFVYDLLKDIDGNLFMSKFGRMFEKYVENALQYAGLEFFSEEQLRTILDSHQKLVDFLIVNDDENIMIDAKGVSLAYLGMMSHSSEIVAGKTKTSILKGIEQAYETGKKLQVLKENHEHHFGSKNYLLIITFKEFYVGNGNDFYHFVAKENVDKIIEKYNQDIIVPLDNMYFLSINDLDLLVECLQKSKISLSSVLKKAITLDSNPQTKNFVFNQHFWKECQSELPKYLVDESEFLFERIGKLLKRK